MLERKQAYACDSLENPDKFNTTLKKIYIKDCPVGRTAALQFAKVLNKGHTLEILELDVQMNEEISRSFAEALTHNYTLLALRFRSATPEYSMHINDCLKRNRHINDLVESIRFASGLYDMFLQINEIKSIIPVEIIRQMPENHPVKITCDTFQDKVRQYSEPSLKLGKIERDVNKMKTAVEEEAPSQRSVSYKTIRKAIIFDQKVSERFFRPSEFAPNKAQAPVIKPDHDDLCLTGFKNQS